MLEGYTINFPRSIRKCSIDLHGIESCAGIPCSGTVLINFYKQLFGKNEFESTSVLTKSASMSSGNLSLTLSSTDLDKLTDLSGVKIRIDLSYA